MNPSEASRHVTLITAADCHLCEHARKVLSRLAEETRLIVSEVSWVSDEGHSLVSRDGVAFPPVVYVDGVLAGIAATPKIRVAIPEKIKTAPPTWRNSSIESYRLKPASSLAAVKVIRECRRPDRNMCRRAPA